MDAADDCVDAWTVMLRVVVLHGVFFFEAKCIVKTFRYRSYIVHFYSLIVRLYSALLDYFRKV